MHASEHHPSPQDDGPAPSRMRVPWTLFVLAGACVVAMFTLMFRGCDWTLHAAMYASLASPLLAFASILATAAQQVRSVPGRRHVAQSVVLYVLNALLLLWAPIAFIGVIFSSDSC